MDKELLLGSRTGRIDSVYAHKAYLPWMKSGKISNIDAHLMVVIILRVPLEQKQRWIQKRTAQVKEKEDEGKRATREGGREGGREEGEKKTVLT